MNNLVRVATSAWLMFFAAVANAAPFATDDERNTIEIFEATSASVVYVTNKGRVRDLFSMRSRSVERGSGTGFVWDQKGHIVTNFHVIEGAREVEIRLQDQTVWDAVLVGAAPDKDLALLRIDAPAQQLRPLRTGDSATLAVGHKVLAIGNPFGLDATLTVGVVSALGREIDAPNRRTIRNVIQTDAAINPGNSGGPLINSSGEVVGVNTSIYSPSGANAGIGFAIPINIITKIVPQLIEHGRLVRPTLGVRMLPDHIARSNRIVGVVLSGVDTGSPAQLAGLTPIRQTPTGQYQLGDVITAIDDIATLNQDDLLSVLENRAPGDRVVVEFVRDGRKQQATLTLGEAR